MKVRTAAAFVGALLALSAAGFASSATPAPLVAYSDSNGSLFVSSVQGTNAKTLFTSDSSTTIQPVALSADAKQVLALEYGTQTQLALVPTAGGAPTPVSGTQDASSGAFSPDATSVAFSLLDSSSTPAAGVYNEIF
jgi:hypothetical protein